MKESEYKWRKVSTSEGKCVLVEVGALISWCICSYRIVMLLVPYMWASITFMPSFLCPGGIKAHTFFKKLAHLIQTPCHGQLVLFSRCPY